MKDEDVTSRGRFALAVSVALVLALWLSGCASKQPAQIEDDRITVGTVQAEIRIGLDAASVAEILGSPNIVTTDEKRREVWIYDKISTDRVDSARSNHATLILLGTSSTDRSSSTRQRTLTIIIKYDEEKKVRDFAYNYTQF
jgi:outer membrane protein assembly factor BamE (lipoprotein component of BamABCDE complex)